MRPPTKPSLPRMNSQRGVALMMLLLLVGVGALAVFVTGLNRSGQQLERDRITAAALAQGKEALIAWATSHGRRGRLPCPEDVGLVGMPNEGNEMANCNGDGLRIGRLPWKTLGLPPSLRDGNGAPLWYAVSANFTDAAARINSDVSTATLAVNGALSYAAIVFSPGQALGVQQRDSTVASCATTATSIRRDYCAENYLDVDVGSGISNRDPDTSFALVLDSRLTSQDNDVFNDKLLGITPGEFFRAVETRVIRQVRACLIQYAADPGNPGHLYPWADKVDPLDPASGDSDDDDGVRTGRVARVLNEANNPALWNGNACPLYCPAGCAVASKNWFHDWSDLVFYAVSEKYSPTGAGDSGPGGALLTVGPKVDVRAVVFLAGKPLAGQVRVSAADKITRGNYLEVENANGNTITGDGVYSDLPESAGPPPYNDRTLIVAP